MSQPHSSQFQKPVKSSRARRRLRGVGLAMSIQLCLLMFGGCTAAGQPAAFGSAGPTAGQGLSAGQTGAPTAVKTDTALSAGPDDPGAVIIHLYDGSPREHAGVFASINRILKKEDCPTADVRLAAQPKSGLYGRTFDRSGSHRGHLEQPAEQGI